MPGALRFGSGQCCHLSGFKCAGILEDARGGRKPACKMHAQMLVGRSFGTFTYSRRVDAIITDQQWPLMQSGKQIPQPSGDRGSLKPPR